MTDQQQQQPPGGQPPAPAQQPAAPAGQKERTTEERFDAIETEQRKQRGILGRIEQTLAGGSPKASGSSSAGPGPGASPGSSSDGLSVAEQVRRGVEEIEAKRRKDAEDQAAADADKAWRQKVEDRLPERRPAEPRTGRKAKLQQFMFGKPDER